MPDKEKVKTCCKQTWRITFIVLNIVFIVIGLGLLGLGIYLLVDQNDYEFITGTDYASGAVLILVAGFITIIVSLLGVIGACGMWATLLIIYTICLAIIIILQIVAGILGFVFQDEIADVATERAQDAIAQYRLEGEDDFQSDVNGFVDFMQGEFDCCGWASLNDWNGTVFLDQNNGSFPESCECTPQINDTGCVLRPEFATEGGSGDGGSASLVINGNISQYVWAQSCNGSVIDFLENSLEIVGFVGIVVAAFEILGIAITITLTVIICRNNRNKSEFADFSKAI